MSDLTPLLQSLMWLLIAIIPTGLCLFFGLGGILRLLVTLASKPRPDIVNDYLSVIAMLVGSLYLFFVVQLILRAGGFIT